MNKRFTQKTTTRQKLSIAHWVSRAIFLSVIASAIGYEQLEQFRHREPTEIFYFTAVEDNFYENPANWSPYYPGTNIEIDTRVVIQDLVYLTGFDLEVNGQVEVSMGASLFSRDNNLIMGPSAVLDNSGEIVVNQIQNKGAVFNQMGAKIHVQQFITRETGTVHNLKSAQFIVIDSLTNQGHFLNYSYCATGELLNQSQFQQVRGSELRVDGKTINLAALYSR